MIHATPHRGGYLVCNDVFVSGFPGLVPVRPQRSHLLQYAVLRSAALVPLVGASCSFSSKVFQVIRLSSFFSENFVSTLSEPYFLNWCKLLSDALSLALNGLARYITGILSLLSKLLFTIIAYSFVSRHLRCI